MGGRLDAVNIINSDLSIISSIAIDHTDYLGFDRESIGFEKAGIYKQGSIAICGDMQPPKSLMHHVTNEKIEFSNINIHFFINKQENDYVWKSGNNIVNDLQISTIEPQNVACVLECFKKLKLTHLLKSNIINGTLKSFKLLGRFSIFNQNHCTILDVAHNPHAIISLRKKLEKISSIKKIAIFSMSKDKDIQQSISILRDYFDYWYILKNDEIRAASDIQYDQAFHNLQLTNYVHVSSIKKIMSILQKNITAEDQVVIFGSFSVVAQYLRYDKSIVVEQS